MSIRGIILFIVLLTAGLLSGAQTVIPGGYVSGTWNATGSPYIIQSSIIIHDDSALYIEEGVSLEFYDSAYIQVEGYIAAMGAAGDSIIFRSAQESWLGIRFGPLDSNYQDNHLFHYCVFRDAYSTISSGGGVMSVINRDDITIFHSSFRNNFTENKGGAIYLENASIQIKQAYFGSNSTSLDLTEGKGGAIYMLDSEFIFEDIVFTNNRSSIAGAIYSNNTDLDLRDCTFRYNESHAGGGALVCHNSGELLVDNCLFEHNHASGSGGAIALLEAIKGRFRDCTIQNNTSESLLFLSDGGGVLITQHNNDVSFVNCNISNNSAGDYGGGVYTTSSTYFVDCLFNANHADTDTVDDGGGGAIFMGLSESIVMNSTFAGNQGGTGTTIYCVDAGFSFINSILWDDTVSAYPKFFLEYYEEPTSVHISYSDIEGGQGVIRGEGPYEISWGDGNITADPLFESPGSDFTLSNESPCIDAGTLDTLQLLLPLMDLSGNPRVYRNLIDLGCYENQFPFSILEQSEQDDFIVYPNPAVNYFYLKNTSVRDFKGSLTLTDFSGKVIVGKNMTIQRGGTIMQETSGLQAGIYLVRLSSKSETHTYKLIIN